jgi:hypothetical protein
LPFFLSPVGLNFILDGVSGCGAKPAVHFGAGLVAVAALLSVVATTVLFGTAVLSLPVFLPLMIGCACAAFVSLVVLLASTRMGQVHVRPQEIEV